MTCIIRTAFTSVLINDGKIIITQHRVKNRTGNDRLAGFLQWMEFRLSQAESTDRKSVWELYPGSMKVVMLGEHTELEGVTQQVPHKLQHTHRNKTCR